MEDPLPRKKRGRDHSSISNQHHPYRPGVEVDYGLPSLFSAIRSPLTEVEDRRLWSPEPILDDPPSSFRQSQAPISPARASKRATGNARSPYSLMAAKPIMAFQTPKFVAVCVRRKQRREVLLALGRGGGGKRKPRRNNLSNVRC